MDTTWYWRRQGFVEPADGDVSDAAEIVKGARTFAVTLYLAAVPQSRNAALSPASLSTALAVAHAGARGDTAAAIRQATFLPPFELGRLHVAFLAVQMSLRDIRGVELSMVNALFSQRGAEFLESFLGVITTSYDTELHEVGFATEPTQALAAINDWAARRTSGRIPALLSPGLITPATRLVLTNATYFTGKWLLPFNSVLTTDAPFFLQNGTSRSVPFMRCEASYKMVELDDLQLLELPYQGGELSMIIILPARAAGLAGVAGRIRAELDTWLDQIDVAYSRTVSVHLPRFRVETDFSLTQALKSIGMATAFSDDADFSGMTGSKSVKVDEVVQKAFVEVDEEGTTAAAATAVLMADFTAAMYEPPVFRADCPFVFIIRDTRTNFVLFLGHVFDPSRDAS